MKLSATLCLALAVVLCYLVTVESSPIQKDDEKTEVTARQSGPIVSPAIPGDSEDDDDDGKLKTLRMLIKYVRLIKEIKFGF